MLGLFGTLNLGARSLQTQQLGVEVAGHNLANVNNPDYSRQRVDIDTSFAIPTPIGPQGTGASVVAIQQMRSALLDGQLQSELSVSGYLDAQQQALQSVQANLGEQLNSQANSAESTAASQGVGGGAALAASIGDLFNSFQSLATDPASLAERQVLLLKAQTLATQFNQVSKRLGDLSNSLNTSLASDVSDANQLLASIAQLNNEIANSENATGGKANDLRDEREAKIEALSKIVNISLSNGTGGAIDVAVAGTTLVSGNQVLDTMQVFDAGAGQMLVRTAVGGNPLNVTGGSIAGTITARDGPLASLRTSLDTLAANLVTEVNAVHTGGFSLTGSTGANFFNGTSAATIQLNQALLSNPALVQASGTAGAAGDNQTMLALAQLANKNIAGLGNQTFSQNYGQTVAALGQSLSSINDQSGTQQVVEAMLRSQRDSVSGVSLDEEMTDLVKFQRAYQASARLITTVDTMLDTVVNLKR